MGRFYRFNYIIIHDNIYVRILLVLRDLWSFLAGGDIGILELQRRAQSRR
jgi:hypothetical protein